MHIVVKDANCRGTSHLIGEVFLVHLFLFLSILMVSVHSSCFRASGTGTFTHIFFSTLFLPGKAVPKCSLEIVERIQKFLTG